MSQTVRTTIVLPEDILHNAKITAIKRKTTLSHLISDALEKSMQAQKSNKNDAMKLLGSLKLGINSKLRRKDLYAEHIKRKMSFR